MALQMRAQVLNIAKLSQAQAQLQAKLALILKYPASAWPEKHPRKLVLVMQASFIQTSN